MRALHTHPEVEARISNPRAITPPPISNEGTRLNQATRRTRNHGDPTHITVFSETNGASE
jgi:hypothetical protein